MKKLAVLYHQVATLFDRALFISTYLNLGGSDKKSAGAFIQERDQAITFIEKYR